MCFHIFYSSSTQGWAASPCISASSKLPPRLLVFVDLLDRLAPLHYIQGLLGTAVPNQTYNYRTVVLPIRSLDLEGNILTVLPKS